MSECVTQCGFDGNALSLRVKQRLPTPGVRAVDMYDETSTAVVDGRGRCSKSQITR